MVQRLKPEEASTAESIDTTTPHRGAKYPDARPCSPAALLGMKTFRQREGTPTVWLPVGALRAADSPRLNGEDDDHIRALALSDADLPPILVRRETMCVIDGMHRLKAATLRGQDQVEVQFFDGDSDAAFVLAVQSNVMHGLPLTVADRTEAAKRILTSHPQWSDRRVASVTGLSPKTVGSIRSSSEEVPQLTARIGRDNRVRLVASTRHRRTTANVEGQSEAHADTSPRGAKSKSDGLAPSALDVGGDQSRPVPAQRRRRVSVVGDCASIVSALRKDPSIRFTDSGRKLLRVLEDHNVDVQPWDHLVDAVPAHCVDRVAEMARRYSLAWNAFAERLTQQV